MSKNSGVLEASAERRATPVNRIPMTVYALMTKGPKENKWNDDIWVCINLTDAKNRAAEIVIDWVQSDMNPRVAWSKHKKEAITGKCEKHGFEFRITSHEIEIDWPVST